jgi:hypothetical protein
MQDSFALNSLCFCFPPNSSELFDLPQIHTATIQLNASPYEQKHLHAQAIGHIAYFNPQLFIGFSSRDCDRFAQNMNEISEGAEYEKFVM